MSTDSILQLKRQNREYKKWLTELVTTVEVFITTIEKLMLQPSTTERDEKIARLINRLEYVKDEASHFGLGKSLKKAKETPHAPLST